MNAKASPELAELYRELADRIEAAPDKEVWDGFAREMDETRRGADEDADFVGFSLNVNPHKGIDTALGQIVHVESYQTGANKLRLAGGPVASAVDVYAVIPRRVNNPLAAIRRATAAALRRFDGGTDFDAELHDDERLEAYQPTPSGAVIQLVAVPGDDADEEVRAVHGGTVVVLYRGVGMRPAQVYNRTISVFEEMDEVPA